MAETSVRDGFGLLELDRAFTCAECGHVARFKPSKPRPCGCGGSRWILGADSKVFDWKRQLSGLHKREHLATAVRAFIPAMAGEPEDPLFQAVVEVHAAGYAAASDLRGCGHAFGDMRPEGCLACAREAAVREEMEREKERADGFSAEIGNWIEKAKVASNDVGRLTESVAALTAELASAKAKAAEVVAAKLEAAATRAKWEALSREYELLQQDYRTADKQLAQLHVARRTAEVAQRSAEDLAAELRRANGELEEARGAAKSLAAKAARADTLDADLANARHQLDVVSENCVELKAKADASCIAHAGRIDELEHLLAEESKALSLAVAGLTKLRKQRQEEAWMRPAIDEFNVKVAGLTASLAAAEENCKELGRQRQEEAWMGPEIERLRARVEDTGRALEIAERQRQQLQVQRDNEAWMHAACATIAEGHKGWDAPAYMDSAAMKTVRELRGKYEAAEKRIGRMTDQLQNALRAFDAPA
jgi:hypothetical protein